MLKKKKKIGKNNSIKKNNKWIKKRNNGKLEKNSERHNRNVGNNSDGEYGVQVF